MVSGEDVIVRPIAVVHTSYATKAVTPVQTALNPTDRGQVVVRAEMRDGLAELDGFDFVWLLSWLGADRPSPEQPAPLRQVPFLMTVDPHPIGLFAMRGPRRPNPIGLHLVRLLELLDDGFTFSGVDMIDGTAILDIKPWAAPLDLPFGRDIAPPVRSGWFAGVDLTVAHTPESLEATRAERSGAPAPAPVTSRNEEQQ